MTIRLALRYDMRAPSLGAPASALYPAAVEQCAYADAAGFDTVYLAEHHGADDGYCSSPIVLGAAIAGRTSRMTIHLSALLAVLHHPLRLAEDLATLDLVSGGRLEVTLGIGYRVHEYAMFGVEKRRRVPIFEETIGVLERAWTGQPFDFRGTTVTVRPVPVQHPRPRLYIGGSAEPSALRAARFGDNFLPATPNLYPLYVAERERLGLPVPLPPRPKGPLFLFVTDDPDRDWPVVAPHVIYTSNSNAEWAKERGVGATPYPPLTGVDDLRASPQFQVLTPEQCVADIEARDPDVEIGIQPIMGGLDPALGSASLERFVTKVLPALERSGRWRRTGAAQPLTRPAPAPV